MSFSLTPEQQLLKKTAADFVEREVIPHRAQWDRIEAVDRAIVGKLAALGFLGVTIPEQFGGAPLDHRGYCLLMEELGRGDSSVRGIVSVSLGLFGKTVYAEGNDEQRSEWLPGICSGEHLGCFALTEPGVGSDAGSLVTRAQRDGDDWLLSGEKIFITNGGWADLALVFARSGGEGPRGITAFVVPTDSEGFSAAEIKGKLGLRGQATASLRLDAVRVPDRNRLGEEGRGFKVAMAALSRGRMSLAAGCVGVSRGCLEAAVSYAQEREQFGKPLAAHQLVQEMIADIAVETDAARALTWLVADLADTGERIDLAASKAKYFASETAVRSANRALQVFGGYGYIDEYPVGKYLRDARVTTLYEGTSQIQKLIIGQALTGVSAFA
ncbi:MAG: acyl-CoA dehydrogenase family protein [Candidatus Dormibacteraeota bacterium]|uniref:Acyl-CoA dehydrogenase n=1 Tax=Candidatus Aeolococcus gillhamiae TaxID=3127015 RepID=A0A2W5ZMJ7_9BACT|nr:acyl-CoA dehydrogenase family protein [Candidatus Dormibacteraeota bacterium]PZR84086.1 MAG: acyl-CoA dehydrogenase [Candidatus Dormibacter sp. RRmetagenome_bin12]